MEIGKRFSTFTFKEYFFYIENHKRFSDFNTLGLFRSIIENDKLTLQEKLEVRDYANRLFGKTFDFLQLKDPYTYVELTTLGQELDWPQNRRIWQEVRRNQEKILKEKRIKHRSFGVYSKHSCGYDDCPYNGVMFKQGVYWKDGDLTFDNDKCSYAASRKSNLAKKDRKNKKKTVEDDLRADSDEMEK